MIIVDGLVAPGTYRFGALSGFRLCNNFGINPNSYHSGLAGFVEPHEFISSVQSINQAVSSASTCPRLVRLTGLAVIILGFILFIVGASAAQNGNRSLLYIGLVLFIGGGVSQAAGQYYYYNKMCEVFTNAVAVENQKYQNRPNKSVWTFHFSRWRDSRYVYTTAYMQIDIRAGAMMPMIVAPIMANNGMAPPIYYAAAPQAQQQMPPSYGQAVQQAAYTQQQPPYAAYSQQPPMPMMYGSPIPQPQPQPPFQQAAPQQNMPASQPLYPPPGVGTASQVCSKCETPIAEGNQFCGRCGRQV